MHTFVLVLALILDNGIFEMGSKIKKILKILPASPKLERRRVNPACPVECGAYSTGV